MLVLGLGWVGALSKQAAAAVAIALGVATLAAMGYVVARRSKLDPLETVVSVVLNGSFGLAIVALKVFIE